MLDVLQQFGWYFLIVGIIIISLIIPDRKQK